MLNAISQSVTNLNLKNLIQSIGPKYIDDYRIAESLSETGGLFLSGTLFRTESCLVPRFVLHNLVAAPYHLSSHWERPEDFGEQISGPGKTLSRAASSARPCCED